MPSVTRTASYDLGGGHLLFFARSMLPACRRAVRSLLLDFILLKASCYATFLYFILCNLFYEKERFVSFFCFSTYDLYVI